MQKANRFALRLACVFSVQTCDFESACDGGSQALQIRSPGCMVLSTSLAQGANSALPSAVAARWPRWNLVSCIGQRGSGTVFSMPTTRKTVSTGSSHDSSRSYLSHLHEIRVTKYNLFHPDTPNWQQRLWQQQSALCYTAAVINSISQGLAFLIHAFAKS